MATRILHLSAASLWFARGWAHVHQRGSMSVCAQKAVAGCQGDCKTYQIPLGQCYSPTLLFPQDPVWGSLDVFDMCDGATWNRTFFVSTDGTCSGRVESSFSTAVGECVGPFGQPRPWGTFQCPNPDTRRADRRSRDERRKQRVLPPGNLILGYATNCRNAADAAIAVREAELGVNVIIWFSANLVGTVGKPQVETGLDHRCVAGVAQQLRVRGLETTHLISVGGWDAPHPNTSFSGEVWFSSWLQWNQQVVAQPDLGFDGYDGIDWDLEGNDNPASPWNHFTLACMEVVGSMSQAAKRAGFLVTLVPPQSYLDTETSDFDLDLTHAYPSFHPEFHYHSHNSYALLLAKFDTWEGSMGDVRAPVFDLVDVQLYESWGRAAAAIQGRGEQPETYLQQWIRTATSDGWEVNFGQDPSVGLPRMKMVVSPSRFIVGISTGSDDGSGKSLYIPPAVLARAFVALPPSLRPRGAMFWNMMDDGKPMNGTSGPPVSLVAGLNSFLNVRDAPRPAPTLMV